MPTKLRFKIAYCSGEDPEYPVSELNYHTPHTKGWLSPRFCDWPQEIGIQFEGLSNVQQLQILSHESKIATKIELYVGDMPSRTVKPDYSLAKFRRLGHLSLDSNERSAYQARELKSVHINCNALFVKMLLHKCYLNKHNLYNQAGIIGISLIGDLEGTPSSIPVHQQFQTPSSGALNGFPPRNTLSGLEDMIGELNLDPFTAQRLQELTKAKEAAVAAEDYDEAKKLKQAIIQIKAIGAQLAKLESQKKAAVQKEDYDSAKQIKAEIEVLRGQIDLACRTTDSPASNSHKFPRSSSDIGHHASSSPPPTIARASSITAADQARIPLGHIPSSSSSSFGHVSRDPQPGGDPPGPSRVRAERPRSATRGLDARSIPANEERPLPALQHRIERGEDEDISDDRNRGPQYGYRMDDPAAEAPAPDPPAVSDLGLPEPEPLDAASMKDAGPLLDVFGERTVRMICSKNWNLREAALNQLQNDLQQTLSVDQLAVFRATCKVLEKTLNDKIAQVYHCAKSFLLQSIDVFAPNFKKSEILNSLEGIIAALIAKTGDNNARIRESAHEALLYLARSQHVGAIAVCPQLTKAASSQAQWRPIVGKLSLLQIVIPEFQLSSGSGLSVESVMGFVLAALGSSNGEVRTSAVRVCVEIHRLIGTRLLSFLKDVKPAMMEVINAALEAADAPTAAPSVPATRKPSKPNVGGTASAASEKSPPPVPTAARPPQHQAPASRSGSSKDLKDPSSQPAPSGSKSQQPASSGDGRKGSASDSRNQGGGAARQKESPRYEEVVSPTNSGLLAVPNIDLRSSLTTLRDGLDDSRGLDLEEESFDPQTCRFCLERNPSFAEEAQLDLHLYKRCPMLTPCPDCGQVVEVQGLNEHLTMECEHKSRFKECPRCSEAVSISEYAMHVDSRSCPASKPKKQYARCALCHADIPLANNGWRKHLMNRPGCPGNSRTEQLRPSKSSVKPPNPTSSPSPPPGPSMKSSSRAAPNR